MVDQERAVNWDDVSETGVLPDMRANVTLRDWDKAYSQSGRLQYKAGFMIEEPAEFRGRYVSVTYTVGGMEEPHLTTFDPHSIDAGQLKALFAAMQVQLKGNTSPPEAIFRTIEGGKCAIHVASPTKKDKDAGFEWRNRVNNYYKLGTVEVGLLDGAAKAPAAPAMPPPPASAGMPKVERAGVEPGV